MRPASVFLGMLGCPRFVYPGDGLMSTLCVYRGVLECPLEPCAGITGEVIFIMSRTD